MVLQEKLVLAYQGNWASGMSDEHGYPVSERKKGIYSATANGSYGLSL